MSTEVLSNRSSSSIKFDELGALEIADSKLLSAVTAASSARNLYGNDLCSLDGVCFGLLICVGDAMCV